MIPNMADHRDEDANVSTQSEQWLEASGDREQSKRWKDTSDKVFAIQATRAALTALFAEIPPSGRLTE